jgi:transposase
MQAFDHSVAKREVGRAMLQGRSWREAVQTAGVQMSRATAYRLCQRMLTHGEDAIGERRQGQPTKVCGAIRAWLEGYYQQHSRAPGRAVQALLKAHAGVRISVTHLNRIRAALTRATRRGENQPGAWQDGAGGLLLLAAAAESNLLPTLEATLPTQEDVSAPRRLAQATARTRRQSLLTLLFLGVVGLRRPWDLRGYTQEGLALLTTRRHAYGYRTVERFLSQVAQAGGAEPLTDALARWATLLWKPTCDENQPRSSTYYLDGHRKPVFSDCLIPRGVIGRTGKVLGCRALLLLHDDRGHPLLATTHRGDLHLTLGTQA